MVCLDEQPVPLIKETRTPLPADPGPPQRDAYAYERHGTATIVMCTAPVRGVRPVSGRAPKTAIDWATAVQPLLETQSPKAPRLRLVGENLTTHGLGSLSDAFPPDQVRARAARLEIHHTPTHGRWLTIAESALSALPRPCLARRMPDMAPRGEATNQWGQRRKASPKGVDWQFSTQEARIKLTRLYPQIHS